MERSNGAVKTAFHIQVEGKRGPGRPKMTWKQLTKRDCREWKLSLLSAIIPHDRNMWRSGVRSAIHAASQLSGEGGPLMWMLPLYPSCTLIKKTIMMTHNICFCGEIRKIFCGCPFLSVAIISQLQASTEV